MDTITKLESNKIVLFCFVFCFLPHPLKGSLARGEGIEQLGRSWHFSDFFLSAYLLTSGCGMGSLLYCKV